jgi:hypothetical protein
MSYPFQEVKKFKNFKQQFKIYDCEYKLCICFNFWLLLRFKLTVSVAQLVAHLLLVSRGPLIIAKKFKPLLVMCYYC